jgi:NADH-quinone oxidoreductase subunit J
MIIYFLFGFLFILFFFLTLIHESIFFSIFFLICLFLISSFIFILLGFEFIGFLYLIVYVGAIAVLFLFMVMLFDKSEYLFFSNQAAALELKQQRSLLLGCSLLVACCIGVYFYLSFCFLDYLCYVDFPFGDRDVLKAPFNFGSDNKYFVDMPFNLGTNLQRIGFVLYNFFSLSVLAAGVVLLVGMVGAIILTQTFFFGDKFKKHQEIKEQIVRKRTN